MESSQITQQQAHLKMLLNKCRQETNPDKLLDHFQAVKTLFLAYLIQQNNSPYTLFNGQVVEGVLEDKLMAECAGCVEETHDVIHSLHKFLRKYEHASNLDTMEFRVESSRLLTRFDHSMNRFTNWLNKIPQK